MHFSIDLSWIFKTILLLNVSWITNIQSFITKRIIWKYLYEFLWICTQGSITEQHSGRFCRPNFPSTNTRAHFSLRQWDRKKFFNVDNRPGFMGEFFSGANTTISDINFLDNFLALFTFSDPTSVLKNRNSPPRLTNNYFSLLQLINNMQLKILPFSTFYQADVDSWCRCYKTFLM